MPSPPSATTRHLVLPMVLPGLLGAMLCTGCLTSGQNAYTQRGPIRSSPEVMNLLAKPRSLKIDYAHPGTTAFQRLRWDKSGFNWEVMLPDEPVSYAGVVFKKPCDLSESPDTKWITFDLKPSFLAEHIFLGFIDSHDHQDAAHLGKPLSAYEVTHRGDWGSYVVRLDEFPGTDLERTLNPEFDWSNVLGIQLSRGDTGGPTIRVELRRLKVQINSYELQRLYAAAR